MTYEELEEFLEQKLFGVRQGINVNQYEAHPLFLEATPENEEKFNEIYFTVVAQDLYPLQRTKSGAIKKGPKYATNLYAWDLRHSSIGLQLTVVLGGKIYVVKYGNYKGTKCPEIYPNVAFQTFWEKCTEHGINLNNYKIGNGQEVKTEIERPMIEMMYIMSARDRGLTNVHHIDFHNSYPAGLVNTHPEFRPVVEYFYEKRKENPVNKAVLNYTIGWMQSWCPEKGRFAEWAHLSRDAIKNNNDRIEELTYELMVSGRAIVGYNTDGIWYQGEVYHGPGEGKSLGQWENDHVNCTFRAKSDGAYEFIENGEYHAVVRGSTTLDLVQPDRSKWQWGDIYRNNIIGFKFDKERGIYHETY